MPPDQAALLAQRQVHPRRLMQVIVLFGVVAVAYVLFFNVTNNLAGAGDTDRLRLSRSTYSVSELPAPISAPERLYARL